MQLNVDIYRITQKEGMYLYVEKDADLNELPDALQKQIAKRELAMSIVLTPEKKLARANSGKVIAAVKEQGFYLQMPPGPETYMHQIPNDKMTDKPI